MALLILTDVVSQFDVAIHVLDNSKEIIVVVGLPEHVSEHQVNGQCRVMAVHIFE